MALEERVKDLSAVPEAYRTLYVAEGDEFALDVKRITETTGLKKTLEKEREEAKAAKRERDELAKRYEGIDVDEVRELLKRLDADEEGKLWKEGKIDQVVERRTEKQRQAAEKREKELLEQIESERKSKHAYQQRVLDAAISRAALGIVHDKALSSGDVMRAAREIFSLDDGGNAVMVEDGKVKLGKDGKKPYSPAEWIEECRESHPHWFPNGNSGGGAGGDKGGKGGKDYSHLSPTERMTAARAARA